VNARQAPLFDTRPFDQANLDRVINVASVPKRSPFRYPGGKTWLVPRVRCWLQSLRERVRLFGEPFAGGGIVSLTVAFEELADSVLMAELDEDVAAVWQVILSGDAEQLARRIVSFEPTLETVKQVLAGPVEDTQDRAFATIVKNRVYHGGILAPGSRPMRYGEDGRGLKSRWYPETLRRRILDIASVRERITFIHADALDIMRRRAYRRDAVWFLDPPYTAGGKRAGRRLYAHAELDHTELFRTTATLAGDFLMTYDDAPELHGLAREFGFDTLLVSMQNTHLAKMKELLIGRNLDWAR